MKKSILTYGVIVGVIVVAAVSLGANLAHDEGSAGFSEWLGYLVMIVALSAIFMGVKRYRDRELGGVIRFGRAFLLGLGISVVASVIYVAGWEVNLAATDYAFINQYTASYIEKKKAAGVSGQALQEVIAKMDEMKESYGNPAYRLPMTFMEIFPVGLLVSLISAAVLRNSRILPAAV